MICIFSLRDRDKLVNFIRSYPYDQIIFIVVQIIQVVAAPIPGELTGFIGGIFMDLSGELFIRQSALRSVPG